MNTEMFYINTDNLSDKILELKTIVDSDMTTLLSNFDSAGFSQYSTLADGSNVGLVTRADRVKNRATKAKEKLTALVDKVNVHIDNVITFENGGTVSMPDANGETKPVTNQESVTIEKGDTLWNMAIEKGHEGSDWQKVFRNADGSQISSVQARGFDAGDQIIYVGGKQDASIQSGVALSADSLPIIGGMSALEVIPDLEDAELQTVFGDTYGGYSDVASPFPDNTDMHITAPMGYYVVNGRMKRHYGSDWNNGAGDLGTEVSSVTSGIVVNVVKEKDDTTGFGNYVQVLSEHEVNGKTEYMLTTYGHLDSESPLKEGQVIKEGDYIGDVGKSGNTDGAHLHLETEMHLQPKDVKNFSIDELETYEVIVENEEGSSDTITMVRMPESSTEKTVDMLYGEEGAFDRLSTSERDSKYSSTDSYSDYVNENSLSSPLYNNRDHAVYNTQPLSASGKYEKVELPEDEISTKDYEKVAIVVKDSSEV